MTERAAVEQIAPMFIVADIQAAVACYREQLGFELDMLIPPEEPFFAIVRRGGAAIHLKQIGPDTPPLPNPQRHEWARWDAWLHTPDPDALAAELEASGARVVEPLADTDDGLRAVAVADADGYVLCFGRPR